MDLLDFTEPLDIVTVFQSALEKMTYLKEIVDESREKIPRKTLN